MRTFVDTNVLVYAYDRADARKHDRAVAVLSEADPGELVISAQVLNEFYVVVTRPHRQLLSAERARSVVTALSSTSVEPVDVDLVQRALAVQASEPISYWDALVVAAASRANCARLLTEDLSDATTVAGVRIEDPFRVTAD